DLKESIRNKELPIIVYDAQGNDLNVRVEPESVTVSVDVDRPSKQVPLTVKTKGDLSEGLELESIEGPEEIEVFGKRELLDDLEEITTEEIDLSKIDASGEIEVKLDHPEEFAVDDETVKVQVELKETKVFEEISIDVEGDSGQKVNFKHP